MSHQCLKQFMAQTHSVSHITITTDTGSRNRAQAPNTHSCLHLAVSHKQTPQPVTSMNLITTGDLN